MPPSVTASSAVDSADERKEALRLLWAPGSDKACRDGHKGPFCGVCEDGWGLSGTTRLCQRCSTSVGGIFLDWLLIVFAAIVGLAILSALVLGHRWKTTREVKYLHWRRNAMKWKRVKDMVINSQRQNDVVEQMWNKAIVGSVANAEQSSLEAPSSSVNDGTRSGEFMRRSFGIRKSKFINILKNVGFRRRSTAVTALSERAQKGLGALRAQLDKVGAPPLLSTLKIFFTSCQMSAIGTQLDAAPNNGALGFLLQLKDIISSSGGVELTSFSCRLNASYRTRWAIVASFPIIVIVASFAVFGLRSLHYEPIVKAAQTQVRKTMVRARQRASMIGQSLTMRTSRASRSQSPMTPPNREKWRLMASASAA